VNTSICFQQAIRAARAGWRDRARALLIDVVNNEPDNRLAWFWLSDMVDDLDEQIEALENALTSSHKPPEAMARLSRLYAQREERNKQRQTQLLEKAQFANSTGRVEEARQLLLKVVEEYEQNEIAWLMLSEMVDDTIDQIAALEKTLAINPDNGWARHRLETLKRIHGNPLARGDVYVEQGRLDEAQKAYLNASVQTHTVLEQRAAERRLTALQKLMAEPALKPVNPVLTLARWTLGLPLLYGLMAFIQGGLKPLAVPLELYLAGVGVVLGSFILASASALPDHRLWTFLLGPDGLRKPLARFCVALTGLIFLVGPYVLLLSEALIRLNNYRVTLP